ncbi:alpha/beta hydrolase [Bradyrhizobium genosp. L]|uniref:alpha/beta fold hydrolase n=1 Tax=Bradyrhizobium genosp. L TaxID=83637 RepID=UPI0018A275AF|nr:alpha/beta hydrolase [Bradyrhizobium genosp. L]QPF86112.1 alpha/beta hydrolase [Bradyrhizobium genosp. L]
MTSATAVSVPAPPPLQLASLSDGPLSFRSQGDGEAVVFLHGLLGSSKSWAFQFAQLSQNYRVIAWDAPGFGQSALVDASIDAYVEALREFVAYVCGPTISLVGHSMGGTVATRFAAWFPERVSRLVLSCSHAGYGEPETAPMPEKFENRMREFHAIGPAAYGVNRARDLLPASVPVSVFGHAAEIASEINPEGLRRATRMLQRADNRPLLPTLNMPVLILTGEMDTDVRPNLKADLLRLTHASRHVEMPGLGHAPYLQAPDYYSGLIAGFLSEPQHA